MTKRTAWTPDENRALAALYFRMLYCARMGASYNKAEMIRTAQGTDEKPGPLHGRTRGSIEAKLMNASAAHRDLDAGAVTMDGFGYRALANYQASLRDAMRAAMAQIALEQEAG